jgi:hypothetical protein
MKQSDLLRALQTEIQKHNLDTFMSEKHKIVHTGCSACQKHFGTVEQLKRHITEDVLPPLLDSPIVGQIHVVVMSYSVSRNSERERVYAVLSYICRLVWSFSD